MPSVAFGGQTTLSGHTDDYVYSDGIALPKGRAMYNGNTSCQITALAAYVSGRGAARSVTLDLGPATTAAFTVGAAAAAAATGSQAAGPALVNGGTARLTINMNGSAYFGRGGGGTTFDSYGTSWAGTLGGGLTYAQAPTAPRTPTSTPLLGTDQAMITWVAPSDVGGTAITGYIIQTALTASFTTIVSSTTVGNVLTGVVSGLAPATTYFFRVLARNAVTTAMGTYGVASSYTSLTQPSGAYVGTGTTWPSATVSVGTGTTWPSAQVFIGDGTNWNPAQ